MTLISLTSIVSCNQNNGVVNNTNTVENISLKDNAQFEFASKFFKSMFDVTFEYFSHTIDQLEMKCIKENLKYKRADNVLTIYEETGYTTVMSAGELIKTYISNLHCKASDETRRAFFIELEKFKKRGGIDVKITEETDNDLTVKITTD